MVRRRRHLAKAVSYRLYSSCITAGITYGFTGKIAIAAGVSGVELGVKIFTYYLHERVWYRLVRWGVAPGAVDGHSGRGGAAGPVAGSGSAFPSAGSPIGCEPTGGRSPGEEQPCGPAIRP